jgi:hypothetical protein
MSISYRSDNRIGEEATWMSQKGIDELCASVIRCAYDDYVNACKVVVAISSGLSGDNIETFLAGHERNTMKEYDGGDKARRIENRLATKLKEAKETKAECERFFLGQRFLMFSNGEITGWKVKRKADDIVELWATDQIKDTRLYLYKDAKRIY